jgi:type I restriction enzyme S subunit
MRELPKGWAETTLGAIHIDDGEGINPARFPGEEFELYSVPSHASGDPEIVTGASIGSNKQTVSDNTVLLCKINPRINRVWVVEPRTSLRRIASTEWIAFSPKPGMLPDYLAYYLRQAKVRDYLAQHASGVGGSLMRVKPSTFSCFPFFLAPWNEQSRIVDEIEKQFTRLDAATAALKRVQANLKRYRASVLKAACEGRLVPTEAELALKEDREYEPADKLLQRILRERRARCEADTAAKTQASGRGSNKGRPTSKYEAHTSVTNGELPPLPAGWTWTSLSELKQFSIYGPRFSSDDYTQDGIVVLRTTDISPSGRVNLATAPRLQLTDAEWVKYQLMPGDLVFTRTGATVGKLALFDDEVRAIPGAYLIHYRLVLRETLPWYIYRFFQTEMGQSALLKGTRGIGQPNLNAPTIESVPIPLPPLVEQSRIVEALDGVIGLQSRLLMEVEVAQSRSSHLRQAVLKAAFTGQLVAQDPTDEPASVLLERIRAGRASTQPSRPKKRASLKPAINPVADSGVQR